MDRMARADAGPDDSDHDSGGWRRRPGSPDEGARSAGTTRRWLGLPSDEPGSELQLDAVWGATSFEVMSIVIMKPFVPLNSKALGPTR